MYRYFNLILLFLSFSGISQELPPIVKYSPTEYGAANQNWMISQDERNYIYAANTEGLLEFNGAEWTLYSSPNETIIRSVSVIDDRIYTGCYMEFGFWKRNQNEELIYTSLIDKIKDKIIDDEQFWNIINYDRWVLFQSLNQIYIYDEKAMNFSVISPKNGVTKMFKVDNEIYFQSYGDGLYKINNGNQKLVSDKEIFRNSRIINMYSSEKGILIQTKDKGFFQFMDTKLQKWNIAADNILETIGVYSSIQLKSKDFVLGTISNGVIILSPFGDIKYHIKQTDGLGNNTVLSVLEDSDSNVWLGLDNGINSINLNSLIRTYNDDTGVLGTVYCSAFYNENLYIGTNQGLFYKKRDSSDPFKFVKGTTAQVWSLYLHNDQLFCGHDSGTFIIKDNIATQISSLPGTWNFEDIPGQSNLLIQGHYNGLSVLEKKNDEWRLRNSIDGFEYSAKFFELTTDFDIYVSHEYKGVYQMKINKDLTKVSDVKKIENLSKGKNAGLTSYDNDILYAHKDGVFKLDKDKDKFIKDSLLSSIFLEDEYISGKLIVDSKNRLWIFSKNNINYITYGKLTENKIINKIPIAQALRKSINGYENITNIEDEFYLVGSSNGYFTIDLKNLIYDSYSVFINSVKNHSFNTAYKANALNTEGSFKYNEANLEFSYSVPVYNKYLMPEYQYKLEGMTENWSNWSSDASVKFENLPFGDYTFKVMAKIGNSDSENIASYSFVIKRPWYLSYIAIIIYTMTVIIFIITLNSMYKKYYKKQKEKLIKENKEKLAIRELEAKQEIMKIKNEQLEADVDSKNRELAVSTMSLIKNNEFLTQIKDQLKKQEEPSRAIKSVINIIDKNMSEEDNWNFFKEAFNNADKDFLKKVKNLHPSLTPNDLRLCAYLRLNLSSKEIAPLLNISVRSVEIKRYRLRKKMELLREKSLVEYILEI